jgi:hypothetical protein
MEVHHHSHTVPIAIGRKKWTHYLWEFLMLFLAVFAGFMAENWREHITEHKREKQYIMSLLTDLKEDTFNLASSIADNIKQFKGMDTLVIELGNKNLNNDSIQKSMYILNWRYASNMNTMTINERTIRQLLSSGNMRLIHHQEISDSIMQYYGQPKEDLAGQDRIYEEMMKRVVLYAEDIFDNTIRKSQINKDNTFYWDTKWDKLKLLTSDNVVLRKYSRIVLNARGMAGNYIYMLMDLSKRAVDLITFLKKEYRLK